MHNGLHVGARAPRQWFFKITPNAPTASRRLYTGFTGEDKQMGVGETTAVDKRTAATVGESATTALGAVVGIWHIGLRWRCLMAICQPVRT